MIVATLFAASGVLVVGSFVAIALRRIPRMRAQLVLLVASAALLPAAAVVAAGLFMFSPHDALGLAVVSSASAAAGGAGAVMLARRVADHVARFGDAAVELAEGNLSVRIPEDGPAELRELAISFNGMARNLGRLFETRRNLVAWASHDLRAPLASLQATLEAIEDGVAEPSRYVADMQQQVRALCSLVDDLFELSRIETGTLALALDRVQLAELAAGCVRAVRPAAERRGIRLELVGTPPTAVASCDAGKVERVLANLLTNALRHTPHDGSIAVRIATERGDAMITVEDTGDGLPSGELDRVFESFWRADPARSAASGGAGLGLAIARGLVEAHGGRIWAENRHGGGARFAFTLPLART